MADCKMGDTKETVEETQDRVSNDIMTTDDAEVEKEELSYPEATHLRNKELPHSNSTQSGKKESPQFEPSKFENKESLLRDHSQNPLATAELHPQDDTDHPDVKGLELPKEGCSHGLTEPPVTSSTQSVVPLEFDANNITDGNTSELHGSSLKADGTQPDPPNQSNSIVPSERSLETQGEDEMVQELKNGMIEMELDSETAMKKEELKNGKTRTQLLPENEMKDKTSLDGVSGMELPLENEIENKVSPKEVRGMELPSENEIKQEESTVGEIEMKLLPNTGAKDEALHNVVTGTELPPSEIKGELNNAVKGMGVLANNEIKEESSKHEFEVGDAVDIKSSNKSFLLEPNATGGDESGTEEEQAAFMKELETFHKDRCLEFKPPRFYGEPLNCLKLWRAVIRLGGYEQVTSCKLWRQVGESFRPPKTCTTVSWTFRCFYEKALLEYEKHKMRSGELPFTDASFTEPTSTGNQLGVHQASGSGRARRDAAARAMQGWHSQRLLGNGEVGDPIIKDKNSTSTPKREKQLKNIGLLKRKKTSPVERAVKVARLKASKAQSNSMVVDIGPPADWVKINVQRTKDCFEVYALVPGLLREEVRVQSDPAGSLVISGQPEKLDNPWGVTPFKKVVSLPSRIDPHQTSAVVTLHGQLFVRVPFEQSDL